MALDPAQGDVKRVFSIRTKFSSLEEQGTYSKTINIIELIIQGYIKNTISLSAFTMVLRLFLLFENEFRFEKCQIFNIKQRYSYCYYSGNICNGGSSRNRNACLVAQCNVALEK